MTPNLDLSRHPPWRGSIVIAIWTYSRLLGQGAEDPRRRDSAQASPKGRPREVIAPRSESICPTAHLDFRITFGYLEGGLDIQPNCTPWLRSFPLILYLNWHAD